MKIVNIFKVADIDEADVLPEVIKFLSMFIWYQDTILSEDLYNPADALDSDNFQKISPRAQEQIRGIVSLCVSQNCAYVRFIGQSSNPRCPQPIQAFSRKN